jgi:hypothetical protein
VIRGTALASWTNRSSAGLPPAGCLRRDRPRVALTVERRERDLEPPGLLDRRAGGLLALANLTHYALEQIGQAPGP